MKFKNYYRELKRRNVLKAALAYIVVSWIILQVASILFPAFSLEQIWIRYLFIFLLILFPVWIFISWYYEITPDGIKRTKNVDPKNSISSKTSNNLNYVIIGALAIAIILVSVNIYQNSGNSDTNAVTSSEENNAESKDEILEKSVAVLAFQNMSSDEEQEYFSDGISEEILNFLAKNPDLEVISRTSSFSYKGKDIRVETIGKELGVNYVLEGSVRKSGTMLRITAQLIDTQTGNHMWSETYDREMDDIFKIQDEIAGEVTKNLEANILGIHIPSVETEAYNKYLQAKSLYDFYTKETVDKAVILIDEAIPIDSSYAPLWLLKAKSFYAQKGSFADNWSKDKSILIHNKTLDFLDKAINLNPGFAEAHAYNAVINLSLQNYATAKRDFEKAYQLEPNNAEILRRIPKYPGIKPTEVITIYHKSIELDPLEEATYQGLAIAYFYTREYEKGLQAMKEYLKRAGGYKTILDLENHIELLIWSGKKVEAKLVLSKMEDQFSKDYYQLMFAIKFDEPSKEKILADYIQEYGKIYPYMISQAYSILENKEKALEWLEVAINNGSAELQVQLEKDPYMDNIRGEKRFKQLLEKVDFLEPLDLDISKIKLKN